MVLVLAEIIGNDVSSAERELMWMLRSIHLHFLIIFEAFVPNRILFNYISYKRIIRLSNTSSRSIRLILAHKFHNSSLQQILWHVTHLLCTGIIRPTFQYMEYVTMQYAKVYVDVNHFFTILRLKILKEIFLKII